MIVEIKVRRENGDLLLLLTGSALQPLTWSADPLGTIYDRASGLRFAGFRYEPEVVDTLPRTSIPSPGRLVNPTTKESEREG